MIPKTGKRTFCLVPCAFRLAAKEPLCKGLEPIMGKIFTHFIPIFIGLTYDYLL